MTANTLKHIMCLFQKQTDFDFCQSKLGYKCFLFLALDVYLSKCGFYGLKSFLQIYFLFFKSNIGCSSMRILPII